MCGRWDSASSPTSTWSDAVDGRELREWAGTPVDEWRARWGVPGLRIYSQVGSTNDVARALAEAGAPAGTTVMAEAQTRGRGRRAREWSAPPGTSLLLSMVLRPEAPGAETLLSLRLGIAAARAIEAVAPVRIGLKWPNDLFVGGRKVAGILCEGAVERGRSLFLVAGIGINVSQNDDDWPDHLQSMAASLEQVGDETVKRHILAGRLIMEWLHASLLKSSRLDAAEIGEFRSRDVLLGRDITVDDRPAGIALGIGPDGTLFAGDAANPTKIIAGTVRVRDLETGAPS
jgi:BirA family transcriptional regulator, biotin operon repressor / biotin---[acetyl-CoA-carboxylase] ligase